WRFCLTVIIFRLSVMKLVDVPRYGDPHNGATGFFFRLTFDQAGGFYIPLITVMMIQMCTFSTNGGKLQP
ncbi:TPA: hypothetical protein ACHJWN_005644, partial [Escherichia coli]